MKKSRVSFKLVLAAVLGVICVIAYSVISFFMSGRDKDEPTPQELVLLYMQTPLTEVHDLKGKCMVRNFISHPSSGPSGYIEFTASSPPTPKLFERYKPGGDQICLTDNFVALFGKDAWPLLHTSDVRCLRLLETNGTSEHAGFGRWLLYNNKMHRYFFVRLPLDFNCMNPISE